MAHTEAGDYRGYYDTPLGRRVLKAEADYIRPWLRDCDMVLDVGCGPGAFEEELADLNIVGVDVEVGMVKAAGETGMFTAADAKNLPFRDACFDGVFSVSTMAFTDDYRAAAEEIDRVLSPGGRTVFLLCNTNSEYFRKKLHGGGYTTKHIRHVDVRPIADFLRERFDLQGQYLLGIEGDNVFKTSDPERACMYALRGYSRGEGG